MSVLGPLRAVILPAGSTAAGLGTAVDLSSYTNAVIYFTVSSGTVTTGVITVEEADSDPNAGQPYTGTWSAIATIPAASFASSSQTAYHFPTGTYGFVRARISTVLAGGWTITAVLKAL